MRYKVDGVVFDCWNTLFHTYYDRHHYDIVRKRLDISYSKYMKKFEEKMMLRRIDDYEQSIRDFFTDLGIDFSENDVIEFAGINMKRLSTARPYPETNKIICKLNAFKLGIITNTQKIAFEKIRKFKIIKEFDVIITSFENGLLKPDRRIFELMIDKMETDNLLMVGDNLHDDVLAAESCGFKAILIDRKNRYPGYSKRIKNLSQLVSILE